MRNPLNSAAYRIAFVYSAAFSIAVLILGILVYLFAHAAFVGQHETRITEVSRELVASYHDEGVGELREMIAARDSLASASDLRYALFDSSGRRIAGLLDIVRPQLGWQDIIFTDEEGEADPARAFSTDLGNGFRLVIASDSDTVEQIDQTILTLFLAGFALILLFGFIGALALGGYLRRRIGRLGDTAEAIISGDMDQRMPVGPRNDEFDQLSRTLNAMLDRIAALLDNLRQVSGDVAHDLRTPLARLRNRLEGALGEPENSGAQRDAIEAAIEQSDEVLGIFAAILRISEIEGRAHQAFSKIDLSDLAVELCESYALAAEDSGRHFSSTIASNIVIDGDRQLLAQAISNILDNALHHTPIGTDIIFRLESEGDQAKLTVTDNGPGVPQEARETITKRFIRLEASRTTPRHGLGLNLVSAIAAMHNAQLKFADHNPGLTVTIVFRTEPHTRND